MLNSRVLQKDKLPLLYGEDIVLCKMPNNSYFPSKISFILLVLPLN
jgi:hypothetical protein